MKKFSLIISCLFLSCLALQAQPKNKTSKADREFLATQPEGIYARLETSRGNIYIELAYKEMPMTVANYVGLAEGTIKNTFKKEGAPYYDGLKFHRIIPGFMIQGGCPDGNGMGDPGYSFPDELDERSEIAKKGYTRGTLAMANRGPNTNGSQFFIIHQDYNLPYSYAIFGKVVRGMEVVDSIVSSPRNGEDRPDTDQKINLIVILRKGKEAGAFDAAKAFASGTEIALKKMEAANRAAAEAERIRQADVQAEAEKIISEKYNSSKSTGSGLRTIIEKTGSGEAIKQGDNVRLHCTGYLLSSGEKFWSSQDAPGQPLELSFGISPRLIPGMEEGVLMLKAGGKAKLIIPYAIGYGANGMPPTIPPYSWLVFDIEILKVN